ncbi:MAG: hypothetical protein Q8P25_00770 [Candidatus Curtissbacteria bacterium]|nr:hypothetical protein [Candidatus Curtissbacteria bacterium]
MAPKLTQKKRCELIERVRRGELSVTLGCKLYGISRTIFYRLNKRYTGKKSSVKPKKAQILNHPRRATPFREQTVLEKVLQNPHFSTKKLAKLITNECFAISEKGVRNILSRLALNTHSKRQLWQQEKAFLFGAALFTTKIIFEAEQKGVSYEDFTL